MIVRSLCARSHTFIYPLKDGFNTKSIHVQSFTVYNNNIFLLFRFGKTKVDEFSILEPLRQCCVIRNSTFLKLAKLYIGPERLSDLLDKSMKSDPVYPILLPGHLNAVDRRILHILRTVAACIREKNSIYDVIIDDPF